MLDHDVPTAVCVRALDQVELSDVITAVHAKFAERPLEEVEDVVRGAYRNLACTATVTAHLIPLTLNRSMRLMGMLRNGRVENDPGELLVLAETLIHTPG